MHPTFNCGRRRRESLALCVLLLVASHAARAQGDFEFGEQRVEQTGPCLSDDQRSAVIAMLEHNRLQLVREDKLSVAAPAVVSFAWPLRPKPGFTDPGYYGVGNFVDHNASFPNAVLDYNCGARTYDLDTGYSHMGTDYFLSPFPWNKMDNGEIQVVAAASGTIIGKSDGNFDRSCDFSGGEWNAVYVQHADGSMAWYGHLKNGSLTAKGVGQTVAQGEFLGLVGSSGNSPTPHLHFEVHDRSMNLIDPYSGPCNSLSTTSWWSAQRPYYDRGLNKISTHSAPVSWGTCPNQDVTNIQTNFVPGSRIYFYLFGRDGVAGDTYHCEILRPNGSTWDAWDRLFDFAPYWSAYYLSWFRTIPSNETWGQWTWRVSYNGVRYDQKFYIGLSTGVGDRAATDLRVSCQPNPFNPRVTINYLIPSPGAVSLRVYDASGRLVATLLHDAWTPAGDHTTFWDGSGFASGVYFLRLTAAGLTNTQKIVLLK
ncbi:MAG TPA: peptidoglycan DD-metalloendopeptidase family protein [Gemmatimonadaceae bacterium]